MQPFLLHLLKLKIMDTNLDAAFFTLMKKKQKKVDKKIKTVIRDISNKGKHSFICDRFIHLQQSNSPEKYFIFERLVRAEIIGTTSAENLKTGDIEYRISYYIISRKENSQTPEKWIFGQFAPMIPAQDFEKLIQKARDEGVILL